MRTPAILLATLALALAACGRAAGTRGAAEARRAASDSAAQFLLTSAAADFHAHRPPDPTRFRDVRLGHISLPGGMPQYLLCGSFQTAADSGSATWLAFATIRTSGYEQYVGEGSMARCERPAIVWVDAGDLTAALQARLDSLR